MPDKKTDENVRITPQFTKEQLINSERYAAKKDLICALLEENKTYTTESVDKAIEKFLTGRVI